MEGMMGPTGMGEMFYPSILVVSILVLAVVVGYVLLFPTIEYSETLPATKEEVAPHAIVASSELDGAIGIVMRVLKADERAALEVLRNSGGRCLQKDITYKAGLSKLKTHRVVARLAERGVIQVKKVGKTNEITVPAWLKASADTSSNK
jgi:hypothetical protein